LLERDRRGDSLGRYETVVGRFLLGEDVLAAPLLDA
jgi:hypothetical protein